MVLVMLVILKGWQQHPEWVSPVVMTSQAAHKCGKQKRNNRKENNQYKTQTNK